MRCEMLNSGMIVVNDKKCQFKMINKQGFKASNC